MQAIYVRRSVENKDSLSIDDQIFGCKKLLLPNEDYRIYSDKGHSGKDTDRPQFQEMMKDIEHGEISRVIFYKLDRISRSTLDFAKIMDVLEKHKVDIISCCDSIDTTTPQGRAMLTVTMTFAQLERETIQQRVVNNYYSRGQKGFYLGGYAPFGYDKVDTLLDGKKTYTFTENKEESTILNQMYSFYIDGKSLGEIARYLNNNNIPTRRNKPWSATCVARILRNPVYVKANADVYNYLVGLGGTMNNPIEDYIGENGCYAYGKLSERTGSKFTNLKNQFVTIGLHKGIVDSSIWLNVQYIFLQKQNHSNLGTGSLSWLQGLIKCSCGYTYYVKRCKTSVQEHKYLYCRGRRNDSCIYPKNMLPVEKVENAVEEEILQRLVSLKGERLNQVVKDTPEINTLKIQLSKIKNQIDNLVKQIADGSNVAVQYFNQHIEKLNTEEVSILDEITKLELKANKARQMRVDIDDVLKDWKTYEFETKKKIAKEVIEKIILEGETVSILFH